jgi:alkylated DNA repair dioxygenase AlkB
MMNACVALGVEDPWSPVRRVANLPNDQPEDQPEDFSRREGSSRHLPQRLPKGFRYRPHLLTAADEAQIVERLTTLPFREFEFHGFFARRRVVSFGWRYDFNGGGLQKADDMPLFLRPLREQAAAFAAIAPGDLPHVLVTEYRAGAAIGWHKDRSVFGEVIGISLLSASTFRLRRKTHTGWQRASLVLERRSAYLLHGPARTHWQHSIPAVDGLRYSVTFRTIAEPPR